MPVEPSTTPGPQVVLHHERLDVQMEREVVRAVVHRRIVTESQTVEVTLRREVLEVEYVPVADGQAPVPPGRSPAPVVVVLSEEVPVVTTAVRPYERVVVDVASVERAQEVTARISQERADITTS
jgi:stress response protein YsnF